MKLFAVVSVLLLGSGLPGLKHMSRAAFVTTPSSTVASAAGDATPTAQSTATPAPTATASPQPTTTFNGLCVTPPYNSISQCPVSPTPTRALIAPTKTLTIGNGSPGPAGSTNYNVSITSRFACFTLNEPVTVYALTDNPGAVAITAVHPSVGSKGSSVSIFPDPVTGTADLALEVFKGLLGPAGLDLKAVWPIEGVERVATVVEPATTPAATGTAVPATPGVPAATTPSSFSLRACVDPTPVTTGQGATLYAQTLPGAVCTASVVDPEGKPADFTGAAQTALSDGLVIYPFTAGQTPGQGVAVVQCSLNGQVLRTTVTFSIEPPNTAGITTPTAPPASGFAGRRPTSFQSDTTCPPIAQSGRVGLFVLACITPNPLPFNSTATIYARTVPGARCSPQVLYSDGRQPTSLNTSPQYTDPTGLVSFTFMEATLASSGTVTVTCTLGVETSQGTAGFIVTHS
ncbi:MAG: hypothetical protein NVSMB22_18810 [Chloroflexota bacterium]